MCIDSIRHYDVRGIPSSRSIREAFEQDICSMQKISGARQRELKLACPLPIAHFGFSRKPRWEEEAAECDDRVIKPSNPDSPWESRRLFQSGNYRVVDRTGA